MSHPSSRPPNSGFYTQNVESFWWPSHTRAVWFCFRGGSPASAVPPSLLETPFLFPSALHSVPWEEYSKLGLLSQSPLLMERVSWRGVGLYVGVGTTLMFLHFLNPSRRRAPNLTYPLCAMGAGPTYLLRYQCLSALSPSTVSSASPPFSLIIPSSRLIYMLKSPIWKILSNCMSSSSCCCFKPMALSR